MTTNIRTGWWTHTNHAWAVVQKLVSFVTIGKLVYVIYLNYKLNNLSHMQLKFRAYKISLKHEIRDLVFWKVRIWRYLFIKDCEGFLRQAFWQTNVCSLLIVIYDDAYFLRRALVTEEASSWIIVAHLNLHKWQMWRD
jgi:hypothetical protein